MPLSDVFYYDETSPTCLRWKIDVYSGRNNNQLNVAAGDVAGSAAKSRKFHFVVTYNGKQLLVHRVVFSLFYDLSEDMFVDHKDGDGRNNKLDNLRVVRQAVNMRNCKKRVDNKTGVTGVTSRINRHGGLQFTANWRTLAGSQRSKTFTEKVYGLAAFKLACEHRKKMIEELNNLGACYTERHGV